MSDVGDISRIRLQSLSLSLLYLLPSSTQLWRASSINKQGTVQSTIAIDNLYTTHLPAIIAKKQLALPYASHSLNYQVKGWKVRTKYVQERWI